MTLNQEQSDRITDLILAKSELNAEVERLRNVLKEITKVAFGQQARQIALAALAVPSSKGQS